MRWPAFLKSSPEVEVKRPESSLDLGRLPRHVAIIMDGNGRWAQRRGLPRAAGHKAGVESVREVVKACADLKIGFLTLYSFSTENWQRPEAEVADIMRLLGQTLERETPDLHKNNVRLNILGRTRDLDASVRAALERSKERLSRNTGLALNLALNYGARQEIVDAVNGLIRRGAREVSEGDMSAALYTGGLPDPDLLIRTSGENRVSNFLLWQIAYAEIHVSPVYWPDFRRPDLTAAFIDFQNRRRRFGGL